MNGVLVLGMLLGVLFLFARWFLGVGAGAPWFPVRSRDISDALELVSVGDEDTVIDLGSGDGRVLIAAAKKGARVIGYEINPLLVLISRWRLRRFGRRAVIYRKNLLQADLEPATLICIFGIHELMPKVAKRIAERARPGTRIVSFAFELPDYAQTGQKGIARLYIS